MTAETVSDEDPGGYVVCRCRCLVCESNSHRYISRILLSLDTFTSPKGFFEGISACLASITSTTGFHRIISGAGTGRHILKAQIPVR